VKFMFLFAFSPRKNENSQSELKFQKQAWIIKSERHAINVPFLGILQLLQQ